MGPYLDERCFKSLSLTWIQSLLLTRIKWLALTGIKSLLPTRIWSLLPTRIKSLLPTRIKSILPTRIKSLLPTRIRSLFLDHSLGLTLVITHLSCQVDHTRPTSHLCVDVTSGLPLFISLTVCVMRDMFEGTPSCQGRSGLWTVGLMGWQKSM